MRFIILILVAVYGLRSLQAQPCVYMAYEGFDYPTNQALHGLAGGGGFSTPWYLQNEDDALPGYQIPTDAGSLVYGDLLTFGNHLSGGRAYLTAWRQINTSHEGSFQRFVREGETGIGSRAEGDTLWVSALMEISGNNDHELELELFEHTSFWCPECVGVSIGYFGAASNVSGQRRWSMRWGNNTMPSTVPVSIGEPALLVLRLIFNEGATDFDLYVNPTSLGGEAPSTSTLSFTSPEPLIIRSAILYMDHVPGSVAMDEFRFADSYRCAAPDQNTEIDLPPVANFTVTPPSGMAPLEVMFDASASYDPEGGALVYQWDFGDGSAPVIGSGQISHTYINVLGQLTATLTVIDPNGQQNSTTNPVVILDESGVFPCQVSVTCLAMASCGQADGVVRINAAVEPIDLVLLDPSGQSLPAVNGNHFENLAPGSYVLIANGPQGCRDTLPLVIRTDSTTCSGWMPDSCAMQVGTNLSGYADWVPERPLKNLLKHIRSGLIPYVAGGGWSVDQVLPEMTFDENGYPTAIPQNTSAGSTLVRFFLSADNANIPPGTEAVLRYDGQGTFQFQGSVSMVSETPGRIAFVSEGDLWVNLTSSQQGDHVRNMRITRIEDEFADLEQDPFYQGFLDKIAPFQSLRFMDWGSTNNNPVVHWEDRTSLDYFSYSGEHGVPYELMAQLCNQTKKDPWICVPHAADEDYIRQMARLFRDQLDPGLTIYLEYSNEVWNWIFEQAHYNDQNRPGNLNYGRAYAEKAARVFRIWHEEFGDQKDRVKRVLGIQGGFNYLNEEILSQLDPNDWDYGSPTHYVGLTHGDDGVPVLHAGSSPEEVMENARNTFADFIPYIRQDYRNIQVYGKEVVTYEGGQHFVGNVFGIPYDYQQAMWDAQYHPEIYDLYIDLHDSIRHWGCRMATNFSLASPQESIYGSWGVLNDIDIQPPYMQTAPKYQALLDLACEPVTVSTESPEWDETNETGLLIWPNPTSGSFGLLPEGDINILSKVVYDLTGRVVWEENNANNAINLHLANGLYFIEVRTDKGRLWARLLIQQ